jgi:hypothetical protein
MLMPSHVAAWKIRLSAQPLPLGRSARAAGAPCPHSLLASPFLPLASSTRGPSSSPSSSQVQPFLRTGPPPRERALPFGACSAVRLELQLVSSETAELSPRGEAERRSCLTVSKGGGIKEAEIAHVHNPPAFPPISRTRLWQSIWRAGGSGSLRSESESIWSASSFWS